MKDLFVTHDRKDKVQGEWIAYMLRECEQTLAIQAAAGLALILIRHRHDFAKRFERGKLSFTGDLCFRPISKSLLNY